MQKAQKFEKTIIKKVELHYLLYLPKKYGSSKKKWPLILFLHGAGECGDDLELVKRNGIPKLADGLKLPFIAVSPQCPEGSSWEEHFETLNLLLDEIIDSYNVDKNRIYLTGLSMGGYGTWLMAEIFPERFAAIAPICGGGDPDFAYRLKDMQIWAFHGAKDDIVPIGESEAMVGAVRESGGNVRFTIYDDVGHDSWVRAYETKELYEWFLKHRKLRR